MEKLPSTLCVHRRADGADNRLLGLDGPVFIDPLRHILGATGYGKFQVAPGKQYAYTPLKDMWNEEVEDPEDESSDDKGLDPCQRLIEAAERGPRRLGPCG